MVTKEQMQEAQARLNTAAKALLLAEQSRNPAPEIREEYLHARRAMQELEATRIRESPPRGVPAYPRGKHYPVHEPT